MNKIYVRQITKFLPVYFIIIALIVLMSTSFALLRNNQVGTNSYTMNAGNLEVTFKDQETDALTISNMYPMTDEEGLAQTDELTFVVKNTGNLPAAYNVYIEETSTSPAFKTVIKYVDKKNNGEYSDIKVLNDNKYIDERARLEVNAEATYKVKLWLAEEADATYMNKTFRAKIVVDVMQDRGSTLLNDIYYPKAGCTNHVEEDGIIYISGSKECIDFNYVWWSGYMWRITAIYPDGSMKMITDNMITSIAFNSSGNVTYYNKETEAKSYMYEWLNEDFLDTLYNNGSNIIDTTKSWNATMPADTNISTKPEETEETMIPTTISPIGLLNSYEYYKSYQNTAYSNGYLNISYDWWLLNPYSSSYVWRVIYSGVGIGSPTDTFGSRPSVYLKSGVTLIGKGTKQEPYRLSEDFSGASSNDLLYTRHSGEYIKFDTDGSSGNYDNAQLFRIVGVEGEGNTRITKIVAMDYAASSATKKFASTVTFGASGNTQSSDYWDYYLNNDWYDSLSFKDKIEGGTYYIGTTTSNYKLAVCSTTGSYTTSECLSDSSKRVATTFVGNVGLLRYGEMFATQQGEGYNNSISMWLITKSGSSSVWSVNNDRSGNGYSPTSTFGARPTYYLKSTVKILSGSGTELDPYIVD